MSDKIAVLLAQLGLMRARENIAAGAVLLPSPGRYVMCAVEMDCGDPALSKVIADELAAHFSASTATIKPGFTATDVVTLRGTLVRVETTVRDAVPSPV